MLKNKFTLTLACALIVFSTQAQTSYSLDQCVQYALENHASIKNAKLEQEKAALTVKETKTIGLPQVDGKFDAMVNPLIQSQFLPQDAFLTDDQKAQIKAQMESQGQVYDLDKKTLGLAFGVPFSSGASVSVSQLLFSGSYLVGLESAKTFQMTSEKLEERTEQEVVANVSEAYYGSVVNNARVDMLLALIAQLEKIEKDVKAYVAAGMIESIEQDKIKVNLNNAQVELEKIYNLQKVFDNILKYQMGMPITESITLINDLDFFIAKENSNTVPAFTADNNIDYQLLQNQKDLLLLSVKNVKMSKYPTAVAFGNLGMNYGAIQFKELYKFGNWKPYAMVGAQVNVPIFHSFADRYIMDKKLLEVKEIDNTIQDANNGLELQYKSSLEVYQNNKLVLERQKAHIELAQKVFDHTNIKYKNGLSTSTDLVMAETELKTAQTNYLQAVYDLLISKIALDKSAGTLVVPQTTTK
jgi:outer membrane protein